MILADSLGFLAAPGQPPVSEESPMLDLIHLTAAPPWLTNHDEILEAVSVFVRQISLPGKYVIVRTRADLDRPGLKIVLGLQNPLESGAPGIGRLKMDGLRVMQLAYQGRNEYGGGFAWPCEPLTEKGQRLIYWLATAGMILDLSHAGHRTARDAIQLIKSHEVKIPVMVSHTGCYSIFPHIRNLPDDVLRGVAELGGVVGIFGLTFCLHQTENYVYSAFSPHLAHALRLCGNSGVCIGTDIPYHTEGWDEGEKRCAFMKTKLDPDGLFNVRYPDYLVGLNGQNKMEHLAQNLDFPDVHQSVLGQNLFDFLRRSLPG